MKPMENSVEIILAVPEDVPEIMELMNEVYGQMEEKSWYYPDGEPEVRMCVEGRGFGLKAMVDGVIAGFFLASYPGERPGNMGSYMNFGQQDMALVAHMDSAMVRKGYRGLGIQKKLMAKAEELLLGTPYRHLMGTAHPDNVYSVNNFRKLGYEVIAEDLKYGGLRRYVFYKRLVTVPYSHSYEQKSMEIT